MVSISALNFILFSAISSILIPIILIVVFYKKERISFKAIIVGVLVFVVFSQLLEKQMHIYLLMQNSETANFINGNPYIYALYGAFAAGVFEEVGRFIGFKAFLKGKTNWKDGIAFGIGHGGFESILVGGLSSIQLFSFGKLLNSGTLENAMASMPSATIEGIKTTLLTTPAYMFGLSGLERMMTIPMHIALTLIVLYGIKIRKKIYLIYAILLHAFIDFFAALGQKDILTIWHVEVLVFLTFIASIIFIIKIKKLYEV